MTIDEMMGALADMGAAPRRLGGRRGSLIRSRPSAIRARPAVISATPGVPPIAEKKVYLGLGRVTFTNASAQFQSLIGNTFQPFRGGRITLTVLRSAGAAAIGVDIVNLFVGNVPQSTGTATAPADNFGPLATDQVMMITGAGPGIPITVQLTTTAAPAVGESVTVAGDVKGEAVGQ